MSATHRAEVDARWRDFVTQMRSCRVQGECEHCDRVASDFRRWVEGTEDGPLTAHHVRQVIDARNNVPGEDQS